MACWISPIDADHTLRGISIDLLAVWPKVRPGGLIVGDDFCPNIWQHPPTFEPTMVFPFAVHFAEGSDAEIFALPGNQFLIVKPADGSKTFRFHDLAGLYKDRDLLPQILSMTAPKT